MACHSCKKTKIKYKKGLWSPEEDKKLTDCVNNYGHACWSVVPKRAGLQRNGKSCRLRWINYLRPGLKRGAFTTEEEQKVISLHAILGNKWSQMATQLPGRTDNEIKNYWNSYLKKRVHEKSYSNSNPNLTNSQLDTLDTSITNSTLCYESNSKSISVNSTDSSSSNPTRAQSTNKGPKILFEEWRSMDVCGDHKQDVYLDSMMSLQIESFDSIIDNYWESCFFFDEFVCKNKFELMSC